MIDNNCFTNGLSRYMMVANKCHHYYVGLSKPMTQLPTLRIRTRRKYYRLIFTGLMAMMMSFIISAALLLIKVGLIDGFFMALIHSWGLAFIVAWPSAYICAYLIQEHVLSRIEFY
ncbi:DUF2798 domain-containing protein [Psychrobacter sp. CAL346-MNA-CIBAN-0220]|uniref:DUF2798 domain-containing protein n=1 Tax=Psychrobacter sp. CAL346-MNA-CIBAN-0220 TaxID=3140457 RepID=UPI003316E706